MVVFVPLKMFLGNNPQEKKLSHEICQRFSQINIVMMCKEYNQMANGHMQMHMQMCLMEKEHA